MDSRFRGSDGLGDFLRDHQILNCQSVPNIAFCCMKTGGYGIGLWILSFRFAYYPCCYTITAALKDESRVSRDKLLFACYEGRRQIDTYAKLPNYGTNYWKN